MKRFLSDLGALGRSFCMGARAWPYFRASSAWFCVQHEVWPKIQAARLRLARVHTSVHRRAGFLRKPGQNFLRKFVRRNVIMRVKSKDRQATLFSERSFQGSITRLQESVLGTQHRR